MGEQVCSIERKTSIIHFKTPFSATSSSEKV